MTPDLPLSIRRLIDYGIKTVEPDRVILFGSRARGDARLDSDYDLAFDFSSERRLFWLRFVTAVDDLTITLRPVGLASWSESSPEQQENILRDGILLYERPPK